MKKTIVTVASTLIALLAFAQPGSKGTKTATEPITVTGTIIPSAIEEGAAASYQPVKTLVVRADGSNSPGLCSQRAWSRCEQAGRSHPDRDQTWHSSACLLRKHGRFAYG
jgi:hypothetical protein